jgi:2,4-dienoyl-CoA reductase-like NADH-dependent reductase (Old Yellow Enzyme family)/thioredoxin reductase
MVSGQHPKYPHLFTPFKIRNLTLGNRIVISAHFAGWWVDQGLPSKEFVAYLEERAKGGVALFVIGATSPEPNSGWLENTTDAIIPRYRALVEAGHRHGTAVFAQLCHPGYRPLPGTPIIVSSPSAPPSQPTGSEPPRYQPSIPELHRLTESFAAAASRAAQGGVDGLELHSHESFLHAQMLNPLWNTRTDEYGGSLDNRMRFLIETLRAMRKAIGDLPLGVRLKLDDMAQRGMTSGDYREAIHRLEALDLVDYLNVTGGDGRFHHGPMPRPEGEWIDLVKKLRQSTKLTLLHAGRIATPELAEKILAENVVDAVCMTKSHICDPHLALKTFENREEDIRFCTRCLQSCHGKMHLMTCVYNPLTSRELEWSKTTLAPSRKKVIIIGAGPAGMEAALTAAQRGHEVIVLEKSSRVGGQIWTGAASPLRKNWSRIAEFYDRQSRKGLFEVRLNTDASQELILSLHPDAVIIATGSRPNRLEIPNGPAALTVHEAVEGHANDHKHVVILDREGFNRPLVAADYLSSRNIRVTFLTPLPQVSPLVEGMMLEEMLAQLQSRNVTFNPGQEIVCWDSPKSLRIRDTQTALESEIAEVDAVIAAIGSTSVSELAFALRSHVKELHTIGDANLPQTVEAATYQGARIGRLI